MTTETFIKLSKYGFCLQTFLYIDIDQLRKEDKYFFISIKNVNGVVIIQENLSGEHKEIQVSLIQPNERKELLYLFEHKQLFELRSLYYNTFMYGTNTLEFAGTKNSYLEPYLITLINNIENNYYKRKTIACVCSNKKFMGYLGFTHKVQTSKKNPVLINNKTIQYFETRVDVGAAENDDYRMISAYLTIGFGELNYNEISLSIIINSISSPNIKEELNLGVCEEIKYIDDLINPNSLAKILDARNIGSAINDMRTSLRERQIEDKKKILLKGSFVGKKKYVMSKTWKD